MCPLQQAFRVFQYSRMNGLANFNFLRWNNSILGADLPQINPEHFLPPSLFNERTYLKQRLERAEQELHQLFVVIASTSVPQSGHDSQEYCELLYSKSEKLELLYPPRETAWTSSEGSLLEPQTFNSAALGNWRHYWKRLFRIELLQETISALGEGLRLLNRFIRILLAAVVFPRLYRQLLFRERAWCLLHGSHPPRKRAGLYGPVFAEFGRVPHAQVC